MSPVHLVMRHAVGQLGADDMLVRLCAGADHADFREAVSFMSASLRAQLYFFSSAAEAGHSAFVKNGEPVVGPAALAALRAWREEFRNAPEPAR